MKKILIILIVVIMTIATLILCVGAISPRPYTYVLEFEQTQKAYPITNNPLESVGIAEYYGVPFGGNLKFTKSYEETDIFFFIDRNTNQFIFARFSGSCPYFSYDLIDSADVSYNDVGISCENGNFVVVGIKADGTREIIDNALNQNFFNSPCNELIYFSQLTTDTLTDGYYVDFESPTYSSNFLTPILDTLFPFVTGLGQTFSFAFNSLFISNGSINSLGLFLIIILGLSLSYGIVRFITYLFRKDSN